MHFVCNQLSNFFTHILINGDPWSMILCDAKFSSFSKFQTQKLVLFLKVINKRYFAVSRMVQYFIIKEEEIIFSIFLHTGFPMAPCHQDLDLGLMSLVL